MITSAFATKAHEAKYLAAVVARMRSEADDLSDKLTKARAAFGLWHAQDTFGLLHTRKARGSLLLARQIEAMEAYLGILEERLAGAEDRFFTMFDAKTGDLK